MVALASVVTLISTICKSKSKPASNVKAPEHGALASVVALIPARCKSKSKPTLDVKAPEDAGLVESDFQTHDFAMLILKVTICYFLIF